MITQSSIFHCLSMLFTFLDMHGALIFQIVNAILFEMFKMHVIRNPIHAALTTNSVIHTRFCSETGVAKRFLKQVQDTYCSRLTMFLCLLQQREHNQDLKQEQTERLVIQQEDWDSETSLNCAENIDSRPALLPPAIKSGRGSPPGASHACEVIFLCIKTRVLKRKTHAYK